jgi:uncharacterized phage-associated protein
VGDWSFPSKEWHVASVHDIAAYILEQRGAMSAMKLQKLVYYSQAWSLVWTASPLFAEEIQAWANGPVVYELFDKHRGHFVVPDWPWGSSGRVSGEQRGTIDRILRFYGGLSARRLSDLTHEESPWLDARAGFPESFPSSQPISLSSMKTYYSALLAPFTP